MFDMIINLCLSFLFSFEHLLKIYHILSLNNKKGINIREYISRQTPPKLNYFFAYYSKEKCQPHKILKVRGKEQSNLYQLSQCQACFMNSYKAPGSLLVPILSQ